MWFGGVYGNPEVFFDLDHPPTFATVDIEAHSMPFGSKYYKGETQELYISSPVTDYNCNLIPLWSEYSEVAAVGVTTNNVDGGYNYWLHSPSFELSDNDLVAPLPDGGKAAVDLTKDASFDKRFKTQCSNAPRTFLNEDNCAISYDACLPKDFGDKKFMLDKSTFKTLYTGSGGQEGDETRYVYAVDNLRQDNTTDDPPCQNGARSRWRVVDDNTCAQEVDDTTNQVISELIAAADDSNPYMRDIIFPVSLSCGMDADAFDFRVQVNGTCWLNTHVDNLQVYDFTVWTYDGTHPGNKPARNPIKEFAEDDTFVLLFPGWHDMSRWTQKKVEYKFPYLGRFGDEVFLQELPTEVIQDYADAFGMSGVIPRGGAVTVCGSPYETANDLSLYGQRRRGGFDIVTQYNRTTPTGDFVSQRVTTWMELALAASDQFRGRVAWAL